MSPARRPRWRPPIAFVLTVGLAGGVLLAMAAVLVVALGTAERNTSDLLRRQVQALVVALQNQVVTYLHPAEELTGFVAAQLAAGEPSLGDRQAILRMLVHTRAAAEQVIGVAFIDKDLQGVATGRGFDGELRIIEDWSDRPDIRRLVEVALSQDREPYYRVGWIEGLGTAAVESSRAVWRDDEYLGVVVALVSIQTLSEFVGNLETGQGLTAFVLYGEDQVLAHPFLVGGPRGLSAEKPLPTLGEVNDPVLAQLFDAASQPIGAVLANSGIEGRLIDRPDGEQVVVFARLEGIGEVPLIVGVHGPLSIAGDVLQRLEWAAGIGIGLLLVTLFGVALIGRSIARPVRELAQAARAMENLELERARPIRPGVIRETALAAEAFEAMRLALQRFATYVPRTLVLRLIRQGEAAVRSEEREVTVLFTDVTGFTRLAERLEPAAAAALINEHFALVGKPIEEAGGTIDKYLGDGVMAFWGAPERQTDHARRAFAAARAIARAVMADNRAREARGETPVLLRLGLHSGPAIVGNVGAPGRINYTLIGDTVNSAERLQELGRLHRGPGQEVVILASGETVAAAGDDAGAVEDLGEAVLPGREHPTRVWRLVLGG